MAKQRIELEVLGSAVARVVGKLAPQRAAAIELARVRFLAKSEVEPRHAKQPLFRWNRARILGLASAASLAAAISWFIWARGSAPLTFRVDGKGGVLDAWLAAPARHSVYVDFSDGTALRIEQSSCARVTGVNHHGAKVSLESGSIHAEVKHGRQSTWSFVAGPVNVRVIGTKFDLKWDPTLEEFSVTVAEGSVGVSGSVAGAERPIRTGERLSISLRDHRLEIINADGKTESPSRTALPSDAEVSPEPEPQATEGATRSAATPPVQLDVTPKRSSPTWRDLAGRGQLREAYAAAETFGFADACQAANAAELLLLGDAARLAGRPDRANVALLALRQRYPNDTRRAAAAFVLGKIAFDQRHAYDLAASWFSTCLREQPTGGFAREASGRLIEAHRSAGNRSGEEAAARSYLAQYPNGPHADLARSLLP